MLGWGSKGAEEEAEGTKQRPEYRAEHQPLMGNKD